MVQEHWTSEVFALEACLRSMVEVDLSINLWKAKSDDRSHHRCLCFSTACSYGPETSGIQSQKVQFQARPSCTDIAPKAFLQRCDRYGTQGRLFVSKMDENCLGRDDQRVYESSRRRNALYVRSDSKRIRTSSSVLGAVDSLGSLSCARREGAYNITNLFVNSLKTFL
jgi:hypothetical protein